MIVMQMFILIGLFSSFQSEIKFMPNLPMGIYYVVYDKMYQCESSNNHSIQLNFYLSKKTSTITEVKGNVTFLVPFDDTLTLDVNFSSWDPISGWKPNAYILNAKKLCTHVKYLLGIAWSNFIKGLNIPSENCPVSPGVYVSSGFDSEQLARLNYPKVFFYGKYKMTVRIKNVKNKIVGCVVFEINVLRPWETPV